MERVVLVYANLTRAWVKEQVGVVPGITIDRERRYEDGPVLEAVGQSPPPLS
jgi:hypothetical protein